MSPKCSHHTTAALVRHVFSLIFIHARGFPFLSTRMVTEPTGSLFFGVIPFLNSVAGLMRTDTPLFQGVCPLPKLVAFGACPTASLLPSIWHRLCSSRHGLLHVFWIRQWLVSKVRLHTTHLVSNFAMLSMYQTSWTDTTGRGTVGSVAVRKRRRAVLLELNPEYVTIAQRKVKKALRRRGFGL